MSSSSVLHMKPESLCVSLGKQAMANYFRKILPRKLKGHVQADTSQHWFEGIKINNNKNVSIWVATPSNFG